MLLRLGALSVATAFAMALSFAAAAGDAGVKAGVLKCNVDGGWGFILGSTKDLNCIYSPASGAAERYTGEVQKVGVDIGYTESGIIVWTVFAPSLELKPGALKGTYAGVSAEISAGMGLGANALVGGGNSISLQPLSIQGQEGLNVAAGIGTIRLDPAPR